MYNIVAYMHIVVSTVLVVKSAKWSSSNYILNRLHASSRERSMERHDNLMASKVEK
jgi:hypothetical protein